ncbi:probable methyltransferase At1g27930 [Lotus japonicus]|uniref:probable methyltransferase At1g27930 n=1 Tax=Lotus japonicus TaxID=34305 RepID=UPI002582F0F7|nr:probable methyltransferase At1g27930 [Lotus japonicus]
MQVNEKMKNRYHLGEKRYFLWVVAVLGFIGASLFTVSLLRTSDTDFLCAITRTKTTGSGGNQHHTEPASPIQLRAILHYATSHVVPQQSIHEITVTLDVLKSLNRPCNFLVFGLGHDSLMWASLNAAGKTLFLEEDPKWVQTVLKDAPELHARTVNYRTQLQQADELLHWYKSEPRCSPAKAMPLRGNEQCRLALHNLPDEVYDTEWDLIMIDAPRGYFAEAPGRMAAIFSATVMARNRKGSGVTHVFLHDVDRKVEKVFAEEFLCRKNLVKGVGRLWHFEIASQIHGGDDGGARFC